jgi:hypothetical protein
MVFVFYLWLQLRLKLVEDKGETSSLFSIKSFLKEMRYKSPPSPPLANIIKRSDEAKKKTFDLDLIHTRGNLNLKINHLENLLSNDLIGIFSFLPGNSSGDLRQIPIFPVRREYYIVAIKRNFSRKIVRMIKSYFDLIPPGEVGLHPQEDPSFPQMTLIPYLYIQFLSIAQERD